MFFSHIRATLITKLTIAVHTQQTFKPSILYDMNAVKAHTSAPHFCFRTTLNQAWKEKQQKTPHKASLKFSGKWLQSENEALFEQMYNSTHFSFSSTVVFFIIGALPIRKKEKKKKTLFSIFVPSSDGFHSRNESSK